ncbi:MAG: carbohydrate kinase family protein [Anaerorhabdus sp.]
MGRIFIVGGANMDITGYSHQALQNKDSNPGVVSTSYGGVGRNIAENCCRLQEKVYFVTIFSDDLYGKQLKSHCEEVGMDCSLSKIVPNAHSSIYLAILDDQKDMSVAISDMDILKHMDQTMLQNLLLEITEEDWLVVDTNLEKDVINFLLDNAKGVIVADPISTLKAEKFKEKLNKITIFKPNQYESEIFTGISITDEETAKSSLEFYLSQGIKEVLISLGKDGVLIGCDGEKFWLRHRCVEVVNATGGGDAFLAAYLIARKMGKTVVESAEFATSAAVCTIGNKDTVNPKLCVKLIEDTKETLEMEKEIL